jgi:hypothetical protein
MRFRASTVLGAIAALSLTVDAPAMARLTAGVPSATSFAIDQAAVGPVTIGCGGPVQGTWVVTGIEARRAGASAPRKRVVTPTASGTLTFAADGTFADTTVMTMNATVFVPTSAHAPTCAAVEAEIAGHGVGSVSCADDVAGDCACAETFNPPKTRWRWIGKYSVGGASLHGPFRCTEPRVMRLDSTIDGATYVLTAAKIES